MTLGRVGVAICRGVFAQVAGIAGLTSPLIPQNGEVTPIRSVVGEGGRVVYPAGSWVDDEEIQRLLGVLAEERTIRGMPRWFRLGRVVTISLSNGLPEGADGRAVVDKAVVILPLNRIANWGDDRLRRVVRHELAHIGVAEAVGPGHRKEIPRWFDEGFAEWSSEGRWAERYARVDVEVCRRAAIGSGMPSVDGDWSDVSMQTEYDFFASFIEFLESRRAGVISEGELLERIRDRGFSSGLSETLGQRLKDLEGAWHRSLQKRASCSTGWGCPNGMGARGFGTSVRAAIYKRPAHRTQPQRLTRQRLAFVATVRHECPVGPDIRERDPELPVRRFGDPVGRWCSADIPLEPFCAGCRADGPDRHGPSSRWTSGPSRTTTGSPSPAPMSGPGPSRTD